MLTDDQIRSLRSRFPILHEKTYLYNCSQGAMSDAAKSGLDAYVDSWRKSSAPWNDWMQAYESLRTQFAAFINAEPDEIAIVTSASAGINAVANAISFGKRRKVVMGEYEFPTMGQIWLAQQPRGALVEFIPGLNEAITAEAYGQMIDDHTAIVPLTQVSFINGYRSDVQTITRCAHQQGALVFLDGYQDCGTRAIDVKALDVDFYVTGTLKYLLGSPGLAFLYVKKSVMPLLAGTLTSWLAQDNIFAFETKVLSPASGARRFEGGSPNVPGIYAAAPALKLLTELGLDNISTQIAQLTRAFMQGVRALGLISKTPATSPGPLVVVQSTDAALLVEKLSERGVVVSSRRDGVRFSFHVYNNLSDVQAALSALQDNLPFLART